MSPAAAATTTAARRGGAGGTATARPSRLLLRLLRPAALTVALAVVHIVYGVMRAAAHTFETYRFHDVLALQDTYQRLFGALEVALGALMLVRVDPLSALFLGCLLNLALFVASVGVDGAEARRAAARSVAWLVLHFVALWLEAGAAVTTAAAGTHAAGNAGTSSAAATAAGGATADRRDNATASRRRLHSRSSSRRRAGGDEGPPLAAASGGDHSTPILPPGPQPHQPVTPTTASRR